MIIKGEKANPWGSFETEKGRKRSSNLDTGDKEIFEDERFLTNLSGGKG